MRPQSLKTSDLLTSGLVPTITTFCWCSTVKYDPPSTRSFFVLKINPKFYCVSVPDFLSCTIYSVLNCCVVLRHPAKNRSPAYLLQRALDHRSCDRVGMQPVEAHTLTRIETYQLHCRSGVETHGTHIWW